MPTRRASDTDQRPGGPVVAVCCSGGGIRSASYNLGALQVLEEKGVLSGADHLIAVSGGAYIAASRSLVAARSDPPVAGADVYSRGSPEEAHLRDHSRYLLPDASVGLRGVLFLVFGLAFNLALLLGWVFVLGHATGWLLHGWGLLRDLASGAPTTHYGMAWVIPVGLAGLGVLFFFLPRKKGYARASLWAAALAAVAAVSLLGAPWAIRGLYNIGVHDGGNLGTVVRGIGFSSAAGCADAIKATSQPGALAPRKLCGVRFVPKPAPLAAVAAQPGTKTADQASQAVGRQVKDNTGSQSGGLIGFLLAVTALVRGALGRLRGQSSASGPKPSGGKGGAGSSATPTATGPSSWVGRARAAAVHSLTPWLGSALVAAIFAIAWLRWTADGALHGATSRDVWLAFLVLLGLQLAQAVTDVNKTSMHRFYTERLASAYAVTRKKRGAVDVDAEALLSDVAGLRPELVLCAAANAADADLPPGRGAYSFTFTGQHVGISAAVPDGTRPEPGGVEGRRAILAKAEDFEKAVGVTLYDAVALSGAAVAPLMGKMTRRPQRILFTVANVRLGVWLPNPKVVAHAAKDSWPKELGLPARMLCWVLHYRRPDAPDSTPLKKTLAAMLFRYKQPNLFMLLAEAFGSGRLGQSWLYVSDGGHYDNLGLVEAFRRGATSIYVFDASGDKVTSWSTLGQAIALARSEVGVEVNIDPKEMVHDGAVVRPWVKGSFTYTWSARDRAPGGTIYLCKLGVWPDAPWDVQAYATRHPTFPTDSTIQQMYNDEEFEAYRALGEAATSAMLAANPPEHGYGSLELLAPSSGKENSSNVTARRSGRR